jgi:hypothetical protein
MKKLLFVIIVGMIAVGFPLFAQSQPRTTGAVPTPARLRQAIPQTATSRLNVSGETLPTMINLAEGFIQTKSQGPLSSCAAWSIAQNYTIMRRRKENLPMSDRNFHSPEFLYHFTRIGLDGGSSLPSNMEIAKTKGVATILTHPVSFNASLRPSTHAFREAARYKVESWNRIDSSDVDTWKLFLAAGNPISIVHKVYDCFFIYKTGLYHPTGTRSSGEHSNHAMTVTGFNTNTTQPYFILMNSWGAWGENGFMKVSFSTIASGSFVDEAYVILPKATTGAPNPPVNVRASRGESPDRIVVRWEPSGNALYYEVIRLDGQQYVSLGVTQEATYIDTDVMQGQKYFHMVRTHHQSISSALSSPAESWTSNGRNSPPGIPSGLKAAQDGKTVVITWDHLANAESYRVYLFKNETWVLVGATSQTRLVDENPVSNGNSPIWYIVVSESRHG